MTALTGGCSCGQVRFAAHGAPRFAIICQCRDCQHMTGSTHAAQFGHDAGEFHIDGTLSHWDRNSAAGYAVRKYFCPDCGCPIYGTSSRMKDGVMVLIGGLDDPSAVTPTTIVFDEERIPWDHARIDA